MVKHESTTEIERTAAEKKIGEVRVNETDLTDWYKLGILPTRKVSLDPQLYTKYEPSGSLVTGDSDFVK